jgi:hypothetical protein
MQWDLQTPYRDKMITYSEMEKSGESAVTCVRINDGEQMACGLHTLFLMELKYDTCVACRRCARPNVRLHRNTLSAAALMLRWMQPILKTQVKFQGLIPRGCFRFNGSDVRTPQRTSDSNCCVQISDSALNKLFQLHRWITQSNPNAGENTECIKKHTVATGDFNLLKPSGNFTYHQV